MSNLSEPEDLWSSESDEGDVIEGDRECDDSGVEDASAYGTVELEIEDDFEQVCFRAPSVILKCFLSRLVQRIRGAEGSPATDLLSKDWDFNLQEKVAEFRDDLKAASGIGRRAGKKVSNRLKTLPCLLN
jgi:general transcription factor 3C polypeptide 3 (transcription factor C subunit 4)